ncbi:MAG: hypothetical protein GWO24_28260, partial [Akkermansiaceae bacterium]|nr:hypothetical protein [Akkermansiaceae bacterium]
MQIPRTWGLGGVAVVAATLVTGGRGLAQEVRIECLSFPKQAVEEIELLVGKEKTVPITLQSHTLTALQEVPRMATWRFGKSGQNQEGEFKFTTYGSV